jgi:hypothetical protein
MATAGSIVVDLLMKTGSFETDTARAEKLMKQRMKGIEESVNSAASAITLGGIAVAGGLALWVKQAVNTADQLDQLSERTGVAVETLNGLAYATRMSGGDIAELEKGLQSLNKKLSEAAAGDKSTKELFKALGITATNAEDALLQLADVFPKLDKQDQVRIGTDLLGKSYAALVPLLAQGRSGLTGLMEEGQRLNPVTAETAKQAALLNDNMDRLKTMSDGLAMTLGNATIPAVNKLIGEFIEGTRIAGGFIDAIRLFGTMSPFNTPGQSVKALREELEGLNADLERYKKFGGDTSGLETAITAAQKRLEFAKYQQRQEALKLGEGVYSNEGRGLLRAPANIKLPSLAGEPKKAKESADPLADEARAYAAAIDAINKAQLSAQVSSLELTATQQRLVELFSSAEFIQMPDTWKQAIAQQAEAAISYELTAKKTEELNKQQERLKELLGETQLEKSRADMLLLADALNTGRINAEQYEAAVKKALGMGDDEGGYWEKWLKAAEQTLTDFDEMAGNVVENFGRQFGGAFEKMIFDSQSLGDSIAGLAEGMARSVVNALGQMAAQWLAYQAVQMMIGKTTQASASTAQTFEAMASQQMAAINAFASTAAIPIVGPMMAPGAAAAALAATSPFVATIASLGAAATAARATGGPVSANAPYLIGERGPELFVPNTAGKVLPNSAFGGGSGNTTINLIEDKRRAGQTQQRAGNNGQPEIDVFVADILGDGPRAKAVQKAFGLQRRGY